MSAALAGRTAIVTGASSGIGLGIARRLTADGARVFAATRSKEDLEKVLDQVDIAGGFVGELQQAGVADDLVRDGDRNSRARRHPGQQRRRRRDPADARAHRGVAAGHRRQQPVDDDLLRASGAAAHGVSRPRPHHQHRRRLGAHRSDGPRDVQRRKGWRACDGHRPGGRVRQRRRHGEHRGAVLRPHPGTGRDCSKPAVRRRVCSKSSSRPRRSFRSAGPERRTKSPRPSPSLPARTADSSLGRRSTSTAAAAWAERPPTRTDATSCPHHDNAARSGLVGAKKT